MIFRRTGILLFLLLLSPLTREPVNLHAAPGEIRETTAEGQTEARGRSLISQFPELLGIGLFSLLMLTYMIALIRERKRYCFLLKNTAESILITNRNGEILECVSGDLKASSLTDIFENENRLALLQALEDSESAPPDRLSHLTLQAKSREREQYYQITLQNMQHRREIRGIIVTLLDISEAKNLEQELISSRELAFHEARHDILTGVPNRLYFNEIVTRKFARLERHTEETMCLLMIDLDLFKNINDTWGHDAGDLVLKDLSTLCSNEIRGTDMFSRYGGEEFLTFLDDLDLNAGIQVAERMRFKVEQSKSWPNNIRLTISIGVVEYNSEESLEMLIKKADIALYKAKALGRNRVCIYEEPEMNPVPSP